MKCLYCGYEMTNHETLDKQTNPKLGDISFCVKCGGVSEFTEGGVLRKVDVEFLEKDVQEKIRKISSAWVMSQNQDVVQEIGEK